MFVCQNQSLDQEIMVNPNLLRAAQKSTRRVPVLTRRVGVCCQLFKARVFQSILTFESHPRVHITPKTLIEEPYTLVLSHETCQTLDLVFGEGERAKLWFGRRSHQSFWRRRKRMRELVTSLFILFLTTIFSIVLSIYLYPFFITCA